MVLSKATQRVTDGEKYELLGVELDLDRIDVEKEYVREFP